MYPRSLNGVVYVGRVVSWGGRFEILRDEGNVLEEPIGSGENVMSEYRLAGIRRNGRPLWTRAFGLAWLCGFAGLG